MHETPNTLDSEDSKGQQCNALCDTPCWHEKILPLDGSTRALQCLTLALCTDSDFRVLKHLHQGLSEWILNQEHWCLPMSHYSYALTYALCPQFMVKSYMTICAWPYSLQALQIGLKEKTLIPQT